MAQKQGQSLPSGAAQGAAPLPVEIGQIGKKEAIPAGTLAPLRPYVFIDPFTDRMIKPVAYADPAMMDRLDALTPGAWEIGVDMHDPKVRHVMRLATPEEMRYLAARDGGNLRDIFSLDPHAGDPLLTRLPEEPLGSADVSLPKPRPEGRGGDESGQPNGSQRPATPLPSAVSAEPRPAQEGSTEKPPFDPKTDPVVTERLKQVARDRANKSLQEQLKELQGLGGRAAQAAAKAVTQNLPAMLPYLAPAVTPIPGVGILANALNAQRGLEMADKAFPAFGQGRRYVQGVVQGVLDRVSGAPINFTQGALAPGLDRYEAALERGEVEPSESVWGNAGAMLPYLFRDIVGNVRAGGQAVWNNSGAREIGERVPELSENTWGGIAYNTLTRAASDPLNAVGARRVATTPGALVPLVRRLFGDEAAARAVATSALAHFAEEAPVVSSLSRAAGRVGQISRATELGRSAMAAERATAEARAANQARAASAGQYQPVFVTAEQQAGAVRVPGYDQVIFYPPTADTTQRLAGEGFKEQSAQFERLRDVIKRRREALPVGELAPDDLIMANYNIVHNNILKRYPGVKSLANFKRVALDALSSDMRGSFAPATGITKFNENTSNGLRRLFGNGHLTPEQMVDAKNAFRCMLHEGTHALTTRTRAEIVADVDLYHEARWAENLEEGIVESFARRHVDKVARSMGITEQHPGFEATVIPNHLLTYHEQVNGVQRIASWVEETCGVASEKLLDDLCLNRLAKERPVVIADILLRKHEAFETVRQAGGITKNDRQRFQRAVFETMTGPNGFGNSVNFGEGTREHLERLVEEFATSLKRLH